jgi:hypothetical protein
MEKCVCKKSFKGTNGTSYKEGVTYCVTGTYNGHGGVDYYEVKSDRGNWLGYIDIPVFNNFFDFISGYYKEIDKLFNTIMDGEV